jgi:hypothetical protein
VIDCRLTASQQLFSWQFIMARARYISMRCWYPLCIRLVFIVLVHRNNSHSDTLSRSCHTIDYKIGMCCFSAKHPALRNNNDWLALNQDNVSEWLLFLWTSTIKTSLIQSGYQHLIEMCDMTGVEPTINHKRGEHAIHNTTDAVQN